MAAWKPDESSAKNGNKNYKANSCAEVENLISEFMAEFFGTFVLMMIGLGAVTGYLNQLSEKSVFAVNWTWGMAVIMGIIVSAGCSGGHLNPAVTLAFATIGKLPWKKVPIYMLAQYLGTFVASVILLFNYAGALSNLYPDYPVSGPNNTAGIWTTFPKDFVTAPGALLDQTIGTALLLFMVMAVIDSKNAKIPPFLQPLFIGLSLFGICQSFGFNCGAPLNPARDLSPRILVAIAGWGSDAFKPQNYNYWYVGGIIGPHLGAIIGVWLYVMGIQMHWPRGERLNDEESKSVTINDDPIPGSGISPYI